MKKGIAIILALALFTLCGCYRWKASDGYTDTELADTKNTSEEPVDTGEQAAADSSTFWKNYEKKYYAKREKISGYKELYDVEAEEIKRNPTKKISFVSCDFGALEMEDEISVLKESHRGISAEESWKAIEDWLKEVDVTEIDMDREVRDASSQYERDEGREYPYNYVAVSEHFSDFKSGRGFFLNTNVCYLQMGEDGMYSMSDGTITQYLKSDALAAMDALGVNEETVVREGKTKDLENEEWELLSGKVSVKDAADVAKKYFEEGTPYPCAEGVSVDIPRMSVFSLGDKYGYAFLVRRKYKGIPFAYAENGSRQYFEENIPYEDIKTAYVVNDKTVSAFTGYSEAQPLETVGEAQDSIISLKEAVSLLDEKMAMQIDIDVSTVELSYCALTDMVHSGEGDKYVIPCWMFDGVNQNDKRGIRIYIDVLTGELFYYTYAKTE